jgi:phage-related baseplate assembly protein
MMRIAACLALAAPAACFIQHAALPTAARHTVHTSAATKPARRDVATALVSMEANGQTGAAKKIVVLGGDGFCGWPTCLHLSDAGNCVL